jgi:putative ATP-binding cassette transporter
MKSNAVGNNNGGLKPEPAVPQKPARKSPGALKLLHYLLRQSRKLVALYVLVGGIAGATNIGVMALINETLVGRANRVTLLLSFLVLVILTAMARSGSELLLSHVGEGTLQLMRVQLSRKILSVPLRKLEELGPHRLLSTLADDIPTIANAMRLIPMMTINTAIVIAGLAYMGILSWKALLVLLALMALGIFSYQGLVFRAFKVMQKARALNDNLYHHFRAMTEGAKELRLHRPRRKIFLDSELGGTTEDVRAQNLRGARIFILAGSWGQLLIFVVIALMLFGLPTITKTNASILTGYALTLLYLTTPLQMLMDSMPTINRANVALDRIERLGLQLTSETEAEGFNELRPGPKWQRLEMIRVTHSFRREDREGDFVLGPIDLSLEPGELVFVAGGNGSGKTTLGKLLTGLYVPDSGEIRLDDQPISTHNRDDYRQFFSAVFFDFFLFQTLIGIDKTSLDSKANDFVAYLQLTGKVRIEQGTISSTELSQGQRKRLALLTAFLEDRPIYLFDEWAADQDPRFKEIFYRHLLPQLKRAGKTVVVITHDDRYFGVADRVIKLEEGKITSDVAGHTVEPLAI